MNSELISVVVPTYNRYYELIRALDSIKKQTYNNLEVLVIDDNEDMHLNKKIERLIYTKYRNFIYIKNNKNLGGSESRNIGVKNSNGKYIAFLDDDDEYYPDKIQEQYNLFISSNDCNLALVYCYGDIIYPNNTIELECTDYHDNCLVEQMKGNIAGTSFWLIKKDALVDVGGFVKIQSHQDGVVLLNLLGHGYKINLVRKVLVKYHFHAKGEGITDVNNLIVTANNEYLKLCKKYFNQITKKEQKAVMLKYYDDRNWNLIILNRLPEVKKDIIILLKEYCISKTLFICIFRFLFRKYVCYKEKKFDKEVLLDNK